MRMQDEMQKDWPPGWHRLCDDDTLFQHWRLHTGVKQASWVGHLSVVLYAQGSLRALAVRSAGLVVLARRCEILRHEERLLRVA